MPEVQTNWGLPFVVEGLQYRMLRHRWDMFEKIEHVHFYKEKEQVSSQAQNRFDVDCMIEEMSAFGTMIDEHTWNDGDGELQEARDKYLKERREKRESLGSIEIVHDRVSTRKDQKRHQGDEIGILTARAPDGELLGVYCGESMQSIRFTFQTLRQELGPVLSPMVHAGGHAQRSFLYYRYGREQAK